MTILKIGDRVRFGDGGKITGTIAGHGTMVSLGGSTILTYAVSLDQQFRGHIINGNKYASFVSTLLVCADGVTKI